MKYVNLLFRKRIEFHSINSKCFAKFDKLYFLINCLLIKDSKCKYNSSINVRISLEFVVAAMII